MDRQQATLRLVLDVLARTPHPAPRTPHPAPRTPHPAPRAHRQHPQLRGLRAGAGRNGTGRGARHGPPLVARRPGSDYLCRQPRLLLLSQRLRRTQDALLEAIPLDRVLTEADHPFGDRSSGRPLPGNVALVEHALARHHRTTPENIRQIVWRNLVKLVRDIRCAAQPTRPVSPRFTSAAMSPTRAASRDGFLPGGLTPGAASPASWRGGRCSLHSSGLVGRG